MKKGKARRNRPACGQSGKAPGDTQNVGTHQIWQPAPSPPPMSRPPAPSPPPAPPATPAPGHANAIARGPQTRRIHALGKLISCRMLTTLVMLAAIFSIGLSVSVNSDPAAAQSSSSIATTCEPGTFYFGGGCVPCSYNTSQCSSPTACGAGTFRLWGSCVPCAHNPSQCQPPASPPPPPPVVQNQAQQNQASTQENRVHVNTISKIEAPNYNLGVHDRTQETNKVCTVVGAPAYSFTPDGAATGACSSSAEKYFDASASCPQGTHRRPNGNSGQYWCNSDRTDYLINNLVIGHTVCMRGALWIAQDGRCFYCNRQNARGVLLDRNSSLTRRACIYQTGSASSTTAAASTTAPTTTRRTVVPPTTTRATTTYTTLRPTATTRPTAPRPTTTRIPSTTVPPTTAPRPTVATTTTAAQPPTSSGPTIPEVALRWSPQNAITQMPLFVWLDVISGATEQVWTDGFGRTFSSSLRVDTMTWNFEVENGAGRRWVDTVPCSGPGASWRAGWLDRNGIPTGVARSQGACWYTYRHMGDGLPRDVSVEIIWSVRSCQTLPSAGACETTRFLQTKQSSIYVTEIQALLN